MSAPERSAEALTVKLKQLAELLPLLRQLDRRRRDRDEHQDARERHGGSDVSGA